MEEGQVFKGDIIFTPTPRDLKPSGRLYCGFEW